MFLKKTPGNFRFVTLPLETPDKMKLHHQKFHRIVLHPFGLPRPMEFLHDFFWITPGNSTSFFDYSWNFRILSLETPCPQTSCLDFFWDSPILKLDVPSRKGSKKLTIFLIP